MARGPRLFSPAVQSAPWSYESTSNNAQMMPMQDIWFTFTSGSYPPRRAACSTKPQRIVSNLNGLFFQTLSAGRIWDITKGCSTLRPRRMKTSTSSSRASLVGHLELLRKEPAYDHLRALILSIVEHPGITSEKRKGQDNMNKPAKPHAALANPNGPQGKPKKSTRKVAISLPRHYLARKNSTESESSGNESPVHHAMFARAQMDPMPKLSVQSIFGPKSRPALDKSKTRWDKDRFGYHNTRPRIFDEAAVYRVNAIQSSVNHWDDRSTMASPKDSLTTRTQEISRSDEDQCDERLRAPRAELLRQAESLLSNNKSVNANLSLWRTIVLSRSPRSCLRKTTTAWSSKSTIRPAMPGTFSPSLYATYPPKPAVGPALRRFATLLPNCQVIMRTAVCSTTPTVFRCVLGRTLGTARTELLGLRGTSPTRGW